MSENSTYPQVTVQNLSHINSEVEIEIGDGTTIRVSPDDASHYKGTIGTYGTIQTVPEDPESGDWYIIVEGGQTLDFPRGASVIRPQIGTIVVYREQDGWMCTSYTGGGGSTYTAGDGINIDANNEISTNNIIWRTW